jgi:hypothetical protein
MMMSVAGHASWPASFLLARSRAAGRLFDRGAGSKLSHGNQS